MSIAENLKPTKSEVCTDKVQVLMDQLLETAPEEYAALSLALQDFRSYSHADIGRALRASGHDINNFQVRHFRAKVKDGVVNL